MSSVKQAWEKLNNDRTALLTRTETYAGYTLPVVFPTVGYNQNTSELQNDYQSVGAMAVNGLANKLVLALFAPSRPFMKYEVPDTILDQLEGVTEADLNEKLSVAERRAVKLLNKLQTRPQIFEVLRHLIIAGNALLILPKDKKEKFRVLSMRRYAVKRSKTGRVIKLIIQEPLKFDELEHDVQQYLRETSPVQYDIPEGKDKEVVHYTYCEYQSNGKYKVTCTVDDTELGKEYGGEYTDEDMPYRALTWELINENHYGTGLVEQNAGDFAAMSALSEAEVKAAILASEFKWLVNPGGMTQPEDVEQSANGAALPGVEGDITPMSAAAAGVAQGLQVIDAVNSKYVNRIGRTFLMGSSVVRDAERVTAEEIRLLAQELENNLGGVYSRLAIDFQLPIAYWLTEQMGVKINGTQIEPTIITGLDALSRNADLQNLKLAIADLATLQPVLEGELGVVLNASSITSAIFAGYGVDSRSFINDPEVQQQLRAAKQQQALEQAAAGPAVTAAANATKQGN